MYSFSYLEPVCCSMSSSNYCFLTCIQVSQEAGQVVWYAHLFQNFPQFIVIHTVKGFGVVNKAEIDVLLELPCFFDGPEDVGNLISSSSAFSFFFFHSDGVFSLSLSQKGEKNDHQRPVAAAQGTPKANFMFRRKCCVSSSWFWVLYTIRETSLVTNYRNDP